MTLFPCLNITVKKIIIWGVFCNKKAHLVTSWDSRRLWGHFPGFADVGWITHLTSRWLHREHLAARPLRSRSTSLRFITWSEYYFIICIWEFLVWPVTLTTFAQWQRARELGQPITGVRRSCMSFLLRLQPAPCFVCPSAQQWWNRGVRCWRGTNGGNLPWLHAHEDSGSRRGRTEQDRTGAPPGLWSLEVLLNESLTRHFLPGDRDNLSGASSHVLLPSPPFSSSFSPPPPPPLPSEAAAHRPWPWWLCSALPPPVQHPRPARRTAVRER